MVFAARYYVPGLNSCHNCSLNYTLMLDDMILFCTSSFGSVEMRGIPSSILMNHIHSLNERAIVRC